jgi:molybdopterin synthase sulfur carrier subunit
LSTNGQAKGLPISLLNILDEAELAGSPFLEPSTADHFEQPGADRYNMPMEINFYATLRPIVGQKTIDFDTPEIVTVAEVVEIVVARFPPLREELLNENGDLYPHVHVFVNGRDAPYLDNAMDTVVNPGDKVDIFPAVAGG